MKEPRFEQLLTNLRDRALREKGGPSASGSSDALERALHEIDVYHAELVIQNQDLLETQEALVTTRDSYRQLFELAPTPILSLSTQGVVLDANRAAETLLGREHAVLCDNPLALRLAEGAAEDFFRHLAAVRESSVPQSAELSIKGEGGERKVVVLRTALVAHTTPKTLLCHMTDVSEQRAALAAKEALAKRLRDAEKLEAIGRVAANIAHDVNNLLVSVISLGEYARAAVDAPTALSRDLDELIEGAWRGARLMRGLLGLSRGSVGQPRTFDIARSVASVVSMLKYKKQGVTVTLDAPHGSAMLSGDEDEMNQALLNIGTNAVEAMSSGTLLVSFRVVEPRTLGGARIARVTFRDEGVGMTEEQCSRIFEPLYTTKASSGGSGLGLTLVHKTVTAHHGTIDVDSRPGEGTRVILELPLTGESSVSVRPSGGSADKLTGTFLLVDDDDRVRAATQRQLKSAGAEVQSFPDGLSAFAAVEAGLAFTAAVIDVNMPGWSGPELVERLVARLGRALPVVLVTGASGELVPDGLRASGHVTLVRKPWTRQELTESLRGVIEAVARSEARQA